MRVDVGSWHGRAYRWWATNWSPGAWRWDNPRRRQVTLCHYLWAVVLRVPLSWFVRTRHPRHDWLRPVTAAGIAAGVAGFLFSVAAAPFGTLLAMAVVAGAAVVVTALNQACLRGVDWIDRMEARRDDPDSGPGFGRVAAEWVRAKKHRVCPLIEFTGPGSPPKPLL